MLSIEINVLNKVGEKTRCMIINKSIVFFKTYTLDSSHLKKNLNIRKKLPFEQFFFDK